MKAILRIAALVLALLALPSSSRANWFGPPITIDTGVNARFNVHVHDWNATWHLQPWYTYFPYEAHFQAVAPIAPAWPNWPPRMSSSTQPQQKQDPAGRPDEPDKGTLPPGLVPAPPAPPPAAPGPNLSAVPYYRPPAFQPVGYYPAAPLPQGVPSYWYGK